MKIYKIPINKKTLDLIPENERTFFILIGHLANEINTLTKLFKWCTNAKSSSKLEEKAHNTQSLIVARSLTGKLYEAWSLFESAFFKTKLSIEYEKQLNKQASEALNQLKRYFGKNNLIKTVRNRFAFHYSPDEINTCYKNVPESEELNIYMSDINANTLYYMPEVFANYALLDSINPKDHQLAMNSLINETSDITSALNEFIAGCMVVTLQKYLGKTLKDICDEELEITGTNTEIEVPYFVEP